MEESATKNKRILEIDKMYVVSIIKGRYTRPGSFIGIGENAMEFFASKQLVEKKSEEINILSEKNKPLWVLVKDEIWGGKWKNKEVSEVIEISENKQDCEDYKANLILQLQHQLDLFELHERHLKLIDESFSKPSFNEDEQKLIMQKSALHEKLSKLDNLLNH